MNASMLSYILFSCLLLSVQAERCRVREIIPSIKRLLDDSSVSCPCSETDNTKCILGFSNASFVEQPGHELACFVDGTKHLQKNSKSSNPVITRLHRTLQTLLDRKLCEKLARGDQCQYKTKGNVQEFLNKIRTTFQAINKFNA
uniref:Interleukin-9 n=1 Tax=Malurus cyaneus samueli TaxID=2593467 RepID=A0A8C5U6S6_9PASS